MSSGVIVCLLLCVCGAVAFFVLSALFKAILDFLVMPSSYDRGFRAEMARRQAELDASAPVTGIEQAAPGTEFTSVHLVKRKTKDVALLRDMVTGKGIRLEGKGFIAGPPDSSVN